MIIKKKKLAKILLLLTIALFLTGQHYLTGQKAYPVERPKVPEKEVEDNKGKYKVLHESPAQLIKGLGFEIQSDALGWIDKKYTGEGGLQDKELNVNGNLGLPAKMTSVPRDLRPSERERFYNEMLKGFRYCRLAGGLYWRGTTNKGKNLIERWPTQDDELAQMIKKSRVEGLSFEYWSPAPYWKANEKYTGADGTENKLKCFGLNFHEDPDYMGDTIQFMKDFAFAIVRDIQYLRENGMPVLVFGLQNEPQANTTYGSCKYTNEEYYLAFKIIAPIIKEHFPDIEIIVDTHSAQHSFGKLINQDKTLKKLVDAWVFHRIGWDSNTLIEDRDFYLENTNGKPVYQNEYEYLHGPSSPARCINTVQNIMNWFTFINSPTWYWIHALKPTYNTGTSGYCLGFWRPWEDNITKDIKKGY